MTRMLRLGLQSIAAIAWGLVAVTFYATGLVTHYLAPGFHLISLAGGLGMIVLGLFNLFHLRQPADCCGHDAHDHEPPEQNPLPTALLMIAPVAICVFATQHEYSARALAWKGLYKQRSADPTLFTARSATFTREDLERSTPKTDDGYYRLQLTELVWSAQDPELRRVYEGLPAQLEGRMIREDDELNPGRNRKRLYQVVITCCAADAQVFGLPIAFKGELPDIPDRNRVRVKGTVAYGSIAGGESAYLRVDRIEALSEQERPSGGQPDR